LLQAVLADRLNVAGTLDGVAAYLPDAFLCRGNGLLRLSSREQGFDLRYTVGGGPGVLLGAVDGVLMYLGNAPLGDAMIQCVSDGADGPATGMEDVPGGSATGSEQGFDSFYRGVLIEQFRQTCLTLIAQSLQAVGGVLVDLFDAGLGGGVGRFRLALLEELRNVGDTGGGEGARLLDALQGDLSKRFGAGRRRRLGIVQRLRRFELAHIYGDVGQRGLGKVLGLAVRFGAGRLVWQGGGDQ
jgi:hypothetical protein